MGMTAGWSDRSGQRVKELINNARAPYYGLLRDPSVLERALRELTGVGDRPNERTALALANILGMLTPDEYRDLIRMTLDFLQQATSHAAWRAEKQLEERLSGVGAEPTTLTLAHIRQEEGVDDGFITLALILQALTWAAAPPRPRQPGSTA
jgi:hypothetical protein